MATCLPLRRKWEEFNLKTTIENDAKILIVIVLRLMGDQRWLYIYIYHYAPIFFMDHYILKDSPIWSL